MGKYFTLLIPSKERFIFFWGGDTSCIICINDERWNFIVFCFFFVFLPTSKIIWERKIENKVTTSIIFFIIITWIRECDCDEYFLPSIEKEKRFYYWILTTENQMQSFFFSSCFSIFILCLIMFRTYVNEMYILK